MMNEKTIALHREHMARLEAWKQHTRACPKCMTEARRRRGWYIPESDRRFLCPLGQELHRLEREAWLAHHIAQCEIDPS